MELDLDTAKHFSVSLSPLPSSTSPPFSLLGFIIFHYSMGLLYRTGKNDSCQHLQLTYSFIFPAKNKAVFPSASVPGKSAFGSPKAT